MEGGGSGGVKLFLGVCVASPEGVCRQSLRSQKGYVYRRSLYIVIYIFISRDNHRAHEGSIIKKTGVYVSVSLFHTKIKMVRNTYSYG